MFYGLELDNELGNEVVAAARGAWRNELKQ
jgi:hypothetical protein